MVVAVVATSARAAAAATVTRMARRRTQSVDARAAACRPESEASAAGSPTSGGDDASRLERLALEAGVAWATSCCAELGREGRQVIGGWPGTMSEARRRVADVLWRRGGSVVTGTTVDDMVRRTYVAARDSWLSQAGRDEEL